MAEQIKDKQIVIVEDKLTKIVHTEGEGQLPQKGQEISALYLGTTEDGAQFDANQNRDKPFKFILGKGAVIKGWDEGFATMKKGEKATLICAPSYAYGETGSPPRIPPNATLKFEVELLDFKDKKKEKWELSEAEKIDEATKAKEKGNELFKSGKYREAMEAYKEGLQFVEGEIADKAKTILSLLRLNLAQAANKSNKFSEAIENCKKVLESETNNLKALYRRGVAYLNSQQFTDAKADMEAILKIDPQHKEAKAELARIGQQLKKFKQKQKKVFGGMFSKVDLYNDKEAKKAEENKQKPKPEPMEQENIPDAMDEEKTAKVAADGTANVDTSAKEPADIPAESKAD